MLYGYARTTDPLGRIVLPKSMREQLGITEKSVLDITVDMDTEHITIRKHKPSCVFCGEIKKLIPFQTRSICETCKDELGKTI